ncbi:MAG: IclR family transcriptional regulator [Desulfovibrionales bacterium]|nr:IclR family transcriptional regulator [Desulfovibrionales bacterium]
MAGKDNSSETLAKGLGILDMFGDDDVGCTLSQISRRTGINKTSVYRYVNTFCELGFLKRDDRTGLYRLGVRMLALAHSILEKSELERAVKIQVDAAHERHGLHVDVGILSGDSIYLIYRRESQDTKAFRSFSYGSELYYLAAGKAAMAFMDPTGLHGLVDRLELKPKTDKTIVSRQELLADLRGAVERGYARNREEFVPGLIAIGAPLFSLRTGKVVGGVSFDSSTDRYSMEEFEGRFAGSLVELAKKISAVVSW